MKNYVVTEKYLENFVKEKFNQPDVLLMQVDYQFLTDLAYYIPRNPLQQFKPCTANGTAKHIERIKKMMEWAKKLKWISVNPVEDFSP